jgi:hypothetical protein
MGANTPEDHEQPLYEAAVRVHVAIEMDQKFHYLCLFLTALYVGKVG